MRNRDSTGESETYHIDCHAATGAAPRTFVVAVGVSDYADPNYRLNAAANDARDIAAALPTPGYGRLFCDAAATRDTILREGGAFLQTVRPEDTVIVFLAGHGLRDKTGAFFFATQDMVFDQPAQRGLAYEDILGLLKHCPSRHRVLLIDACQAGDKDPLPAPVMPAGNPDSPDSADSSTNVDTAEGKKGHAL